MNNRESVNDDTVTIVIKLFRRLPTMNIGPIFMMPIPRRGQSNEKFRKSTTLLQKILACMSEEATDSCRDDEDDDNDSSCENPILTNESTLPGMLKNVLG